MPVKQTGDPRLQALFGASDPREAGVRPTVRLPRKGLPPLVVAGMALILAVLLFSVLNARRTREAQPSATAGPANGRSSGWAEAPPLYVPPVPQPLIAPPPGEQSKPAQVLAVPTPAPATRVVVAPAPASAPVPQPIPMPLPVPPQPQSATQRTSSGSPLVIDNGQAGNGTAAPTSRGFDAAGQGVTRMRASAFANRSMTVPQGYLIPAVLETGFDSTKPGFARAVVSRDVRGFDGKNVLIPRGSRLIGDYKSAAGQGQNRAIINWTRLIRPDGMTITLDSPATDPLGRGGVAASVNTHFFARLGNALLQTSFAVGQALAGRSVTGPVVVLQGTAANNAAQVVAPTSDYTPTLKVAPGKSISVFAAHDLDFSGTASAQ